MSEVINGVPRELLERAERNLCSGEEAYRTQQDLRAVLTAQPQASAAQSAPAGEREAFEQHASDRKLELCKVTPCDGSPPRYDAAASEWVSFQAGAAWQRAQSAPVVPEECPHMIVFDDTDRQPLTFAGTGARPAAMKAWEQISGSWNAHLFVRVERKSRDDRYPCAVIATAQPAARQEQGDEVRRLREAVARADEVLAALTACTTPLDRLERKFGEDWCQSVDKVRSELIAALSAQQMEGKV